MDIQVSEIHLVKDILNINNVDFLNKVADFVQSENPDFWNELSTSYKREINLGIAELERGEKTSYDTFLKKIS
tara:strand:- start:5189 stop:5407 length:219 start_codon:yes stop_codon:yes gene_type:complete